MRGRRSAARAALAAALGLTLAPAHASRAVEPPRADPPVVKELEALARAARPGLYPRFLRGEQVYWTVVGVEGDEREALFDEDGRLEVSAGAFSLEPFVQLDGALVTSADVRLEQSLADGWLPIPAVTWTRDDFALRVRAFAAGGPGRVRLYASYRLENRGRAPARGALVVALRPLQVLPPWQTLNLEPAFAPVRELAFDGRSVRADGAPSVLALAPPDGFAAAPETGGAFAARLTDPRATGPAELRDARGLAAGALRFGFELAPGAAREFHLRVPLSAEAETDAPPDAAAAEVEVAAALTATSERWRAALGRFELSLPPAAAPAEQTLRSALAHVLIHRDGPRIQPGSRNYARSWIRDGALSSNALLDFGFSDEVRDFLRWYAGFQFPDGKIPCCVDARGADPTPEHDSDGEFIHAVASHFRFTRDRALAAELWPHVVRAVEHIAALRSQRTTDAFRTPEKRAYFGLLPESISHEGYAKRAVHSYWDDLFALRGLRDAAFLAEALGDGPRAAPFAALAADFQRDLLASYAAAMALHGIDYLPGSVELGDFDPTSTAIALATGLEPHDLPEPALRRTFARYAAEMDARRHAGLDRDAWTPYELRIADAFVRLGERERAGELLELALADRRPLAWNGWPEILWREPRRPSFVGDMPHGWGASSFLRTLRSALVYERESDGALVVAAGVPAAWLEGGGRVRAARLPTHFGLLDLELWRGTDGALRARLGGAAAPPGGIVLSPPLAAPLRAAELNGAPVPFGPGSIVVRELPAEVTLR
jgi:hypothetical protein